MSSRLLDIARKFNVFYLNGNFTVKVFVLTNFLLCNKKKFLAITICFLSIV